ncbi:MAG: hypothetical protein HC769_32090 [Cyanobacteria bacterium CRU_2_1]|nr:hypothetical protein [Cyanobacteria bacterium CRU_2_1]
MDDAWNHEHVELFRVGGANCRVLVTTREATIRGATYCNLDVMTPKESLELLQKPLNKPLTEAEQQQAQQLAQTVGYLPLALDLVAALVKNGVSWQELLEGLRSEIARLEALELPGADCCTNEEKRKDFSLIASFNLSLRSLKSERLRQFAWFGVLPDDVVITDTMAATLWDIDSRDASTALRDFKTKALLLPGATRDDQKPTYRLHDLMHATAKRLLTTDSSPNQPEELPGLGLSWTAAHSILLDRYRSKTQQGLWHTLPDDGYIYANLSWHLEKANRTEELHQLLMEETAQGRNRWYEACDRLGQAANFVADVARAWRLAEEMFEENPQQSIALQCRYALIVTSLNSLAGNIPSRLMAALVKQKLWNPEQGLAYAQQVKESKQRAEALSALAPHLSKSLIPIAFDTARGIQDDFDRANALNGLAPYLPPELLQKALDTALDIQSGDARADALNGLAPHLPPELLQQALKVTRSIQDNYELACTLSGLALHLPPELLQEALEAARGIQDDCQRADALSRLAPHLPEILQEAFEAAHNVRYTHELVDDLCRLVPHLPPELLQQAFETAFSIQHDYYRGDALGTLAPYLPPELLQQAFETAFSIQSNWCFDHALE